MVINHHPITSHVIICHLKQIVVQRVREVEEDKTALKKHGR